MYYSLDDEHIESLYEIAKKHTEAIFIEKATELEISKLREYKKIGIMSGASTSKENIDEVIQYIKDIN